jgi:hypothetical protein
VVHQILVMTVHLPAHNPFSMDPTPALYTIRINGHLGATVLSAFPAMVSRQEDAHTVLTGLLDRSALYGVLAEIEMLGLDIIELRQMMAERQPSRPGEFDALRRLPPW